MSRHRPQPVMPFTGSPFDRDGRELPGLGMYRAEARRSFA
jgi:hypothetical protein